jgi:hypothetical protein
MVAIANRFDNLVNPVDYRHALSPSEALATMWAREKTRFDPALLGLFVRAMGVYPPGSIVQLSDGRIGAVIRSAACTTKPLVPAGHDLRTGGAAPAINHRRSGATPTGIVDRTPAAPAASLAG